MMLYQMIIEDILCDPTRVPFNRKGFLDLTALTKMLKEECPGDYELVWSHRHKRMGVYDDIDVELIRPEFRDDDGRVEWMLRWT